MQNQLSEITTGNRKGVLVEATLLDTEGKSVPINKYKFTSNAYLGMELRVLQNVPDGFTLNVMVMDTSKPAPKFIDFIYDSMEPFGVYVLHEGVDCMIASGKFKACHSCRKL